MAGILFLICQGYFEAKFIKDLKNKNFFETANTDFLKYQEVRIVKFRSE